MTTPEGAFCASLDADSEGEEGKFYVWSLDEIAGVLGQEDAAFFARHYDVTAGGKFRRPQHPQPPRPRAGKRGRRSASCVAPRLLAARAARVRPGLDDKVLADWNGLMIAGLVNAGVVFDEPSWLEMAARAFMFIAAKMAHGDRLGHSWRDGKLLFPGLASDHATMIRAALALYEATGERAYLERALAWQATLDRHYANPETGGYFLTADDAEGLVVRPNAASRRGDAEPERGRGAKPGASRLPLRRRRLARARPTACSTGCCRSQPRNLFMHLSLFNALDLRLRAAEIVVAGSGPRADELVAAALKLPFLGRVVLRAPSADALPPSHPAQEKLAATTEAPRPSSASASAARCRSRSRTIGRNGEGHAPVGRPRQASLQIFKLQWPWSIAPGPRRR